MKLIRSSCTSDAKQLVTNLQFLGYHVNFVLRTTNVEVQCMDTTLPIIVWLVTVCSPIFLQEFLKPRPPTKLEQVLRYSRKTRQKGRSLGRWGLFSVLHPLKRHQLRTFAVEERPVVRNHWIKSETHCSNRYLLLKQAISGSSCV